MTDTLAAVRRVADEEIEGLTGVTLDTACMADPSTQPPGAPAELAIVSADAWGPTFHARRRHWRVDVTAASRHAGDGTTAVQRGRLDDHIRQQLHAATVQQRRIAAAAAALGIHAPMPIPASAGSEDLAHLSIDALAARTMVETMGAAGARDHLAALLGALLRSSVGNEIRLVTSSGLAEFQHRTATIVPFITIAASTHAALAGNVLTLDATIPETLLAAATGRPLGTIVSTGVAALDGATVTSAVNEDDGVEITLSSAMAPVTSILGVPGDGGGAA